MFLGTRAAHGDGQILVTHYRAVAVSEGYGLVVGGCCREWSMVGNGIELLVQG